MPTRRFPVVDMIDASELTRSGRPMAIDWAIMPPNDALIHVGLLDAEVVEQADGIARHVVEQVGAFTPSRQKAGEAGHAGPDLARAAGVAVVEADDAEALAASSSQNSRSQDELHSEPHHEQ